MSAATDFVWKPEYDKTLEQIASDDVVEIEWTKLREIIKHRIDRNVTTFLSSPSYQQPNLPPTFSPKPLPHGGLKLPPFPPRNRDESNVNEAPISYMNEQQANEIKNVVYSQLHGFDEHPPFTIQRLCELCARPTQHYKSVGKYLRAVEKTLLVTSTTDEFPPSKESAKDTLLGVSAIANYTHNPPSTPLFSPIPFLHDDARRSKSLSPPPSPLLLSSGITGVAPRSPEQRALGLVDEMDDPGPGHLREYPLPLTAMATMPTSRPLISTLEQRFVRATDGERRHEEEGEADMELDDAEDKENKG